MAVDRKIKRIKIRGHRASRKITCPYCETTLNVTIVLHLRQKHPKEWRAWTDEFFHIYNKTNDLKRVMRAFTNADGQPILSWSVIDSEIKKKIARTGIGPTFLPKRIVSRWEPSPDDYTRFSTTVWDVPRRGNWGVHQATYCGNWAPQIPRALLEHYSKPGDRVLDPFVGGGTTLLEAWILGRHAVGLDISQFALELTNSRLKELRTKAARESLFGLPDVQIGVRNGDARVLEGIKPDSFDFICTHPPYGDALTYSPGDPADLSQISEPAKFMDELAKVGKRFWEVLKPGAYCALLIGDLRRNGTLHPLGLETLCRFRECGFHAEEIIIKTQHQDRSTEFYFKGGKLRFRLSHEYVLVFRKPFQEARSITT